MDELIEQTVYTWEQLGEYFGFAPQRFRAGGGMIITKPRRALLLITHPGGAQHIDYKDYWDGDDLIYTGRGLIGDQELSRENLRLATNDMTNLLFEKAGNFRLKFVGEVYPETHWWGEGPDQTGQSRRVIRFRLRFATPMNRVNDQLAVQEGEVRLRLHEERERDVRIIAMAKQAWMEKDSTLPCCVCQFSFLDLYGEAGKGFIEAHHIVPLASLSQDQLALTTIEDLAPVCSNCHTMLHKNPYPSIHDLRLRINQPSN
jgi:hypothetical protein